MMRPRWLQRCTPAVLALFVTMSALPRATAFVHRHAGGGHTHVHPWGEDAVHAHDDGHHRHDEADAGHRTGGVERPHGALAGHVHWQLPFQTATRAAAPQLTRVTFADSVVERPRLPSGHAAALPTPARAPPAPRFASLDS